MGPGSNSQAIDAPHCPIQAVPSWIDSMVMAKPIEFWKARALPTISGVQALADMAEKCGESATTVAPQRSSKSSLTQPGASTSKGNSAQHIAERASAVAATRALPTRRLHQPPIRQPSAPIAIMAKASPDKEPLPGSARPLTMIRAGVSVQKAYNSH